MYVFTEITLFMFNYQYYGNASCICYTVILSNFY